MVTAEEEQKRPEPNLDENQISDEKIVKKKKNKNKRNKLPKLVLNLMYTVYPIIKKVAK